MNRVWWTHISAFQVLSFSQIESTHTHAHTRDGKVVTHGPNQYIEMLCRVWLLQSINMVFISCQHLKCRSSAPLRRSSKLGLMVLIPRCAWKGPRPNEHARFPSPPSSPTASPTEGEGHLPLCSVLNQTASALPPTWAVTRGCRTDISCLPSLPPHPLGGLLPQTKWRKGRNRGNS